MSEASLTFNVYEEDVNEDTTIDLSSQGLKTVPDLKNDMICTIYLNNNKIKTLPEDFFPCLPSLMWLDLRDNRLTDIPATIKNHPSLTHLLLQNNCLTSLPNELGTVHLKVLQLNGNPLMYPPRETISAGVPKLLKYLNDKFVESFLPSDISDNVSTNENYQEAAYRSYNSLVERIKDEKKPLSVKFCEKESLDGEPVGLFGRLRGKCPKLDKSRHKRVPKHSQSAKYLKPLYCDGKEEHEEKIKQGFLKDLAMQKHKDLVAARERILQDRRNIELLKNWRQNYRRMPYTDPSYKLEAPNIPYDTSPEYMTLLTREDIEKDLPDKYRKSLVRRSKTSQPRKNRNDVHLAIRIKQLFENLEAIDLNKKNLTPRTEQKVLLNEIQKISEIKQKLMELSAVNQRSCSLN